MAKGFDDLIEFLLEEIALRGEQGMCGLSGCRRAQCEDFCKVLPCDESRPHSLSDYPFEEISCLWPSCTALHFVAARVWSHVRLPWLPCGASAFLPLHFAVHRLTGPRVRRRKHFRLQGPYS